MARVKGLTFADIRAFVEQRRGPEGWRALRDRFPEQERSVLDAVVAVGWYDLDLHVRALDGMAEVLSVDMRSAMAEYARFAAERHVSRVYRVLFLFANPALVLEKSGDFWSRFYDTGTWNVVREAPTRARGDLTGFARPSQAHCEFLTHYVAELFRRVGAKEPRCTHPRCRVRGEAVCTYVVEWK